MSLYRKNLIKLIKNKNFINSQNYVLSKKLVKNIKKWMDTTSWKWSNKKNIIWFNYRKKIQEIAIVNIKRENKKLQYLILGFDLVIILSFIMDYIENWFQIEFVFIILFLIVFTIPWFINFDSKKGYKFFKNNNKIIIYKK